MEIIRQFLEAQSSFNSENKDKSAFVIKRERFEDVARKQQWIPKEDVIKIFNDNIIATADGAYGEDFEIIAMEIEDKYNYINKDKND